MILPPATLGMLGGGQLGRFFVIAAHEMGYRVLVLDPDPHSPAGRIADQHLVAAYDDADALDRIGATCAAVTTEFENVPADIVGLSVQVCAGSPIRRVRGSRAESRTREDLSAGQWISGRAVRGDPQRIRCRCHRRRSASGRIEDCPIRLRRQGAGARCDARRGSKCLSPLQERDPACSSNSCRSMSRSRWCWRVATTDRPVASRSPRTGIATAFSM